MVSRVLPAFFREKFLFCFVISVEFTQICLTMDETILFPSPNWFQASGFAVTIDEWLVYGGPSKSLCVLEPLPQDHDSVVKGHQGHTAHVVNRAHPEKIISVDISPEWPEKRVVLTGSADGAVKQWSFEKNDRTLKIKSTHSHEIHSNEREEAIGVGYCKDGYAVTVGSYGHIVKWDLNSNVAKSFNHVLKNFRPISMACSPHIHMNIAIGTKQGVIFLLDLNGSPRIVYKVRCQEEEIIKVSWCPQYEVAVRKSLKETDKKSLVTDRMDKIRQETESPDTLKALDERVKNSQTTEQPTIINEKLQPIPQSPPKETLDESGTGKTLPEDSFDFETVVQEDDMFDIYKDHEADEFGHKKFEPVDLIVQLPEEAIKEDYLTECLKLKEEILKKKAQSDASISSLVDAMDKTQIEPKEQVRASRNDSPMEGKIIKGEVESSVHIHKHLLACVGKQGNVRVWSKTGKLVGSCSLSGAIQPTTITSTGKQKGQQRQSAVLCTTVLWSQPDVLLIADGKGQLLECNPLKIDCKNKLEYRVLHSEHRRGLFAVATNAPRIQTPEMGAASRHAAVWSAAQDRSLVRYRLDTGEVQNYMTCGGFLYTLQACPYDAKKIAMSVGDGAVRVWEADTLPHDDSQLTAGHTASYWQNVQGKVLTVAWHPEKENVVAFGTAESRVGVIDTSGKGEKPAKVLPPAKTGGVYALCWGEGNTLFAASGGELQSYTANRYDNAPTTIPVVFEGVKWEVSTLQWTSRGVALGSTNGAVAVCTKNFSVEAAAFVFKRMIHTIDWHPQETSSASEPSAYRDLLAVCSVDKTNTVAILQYEEKEDGSKQLTTWKTLSGHTNTVLQLAWSPHRDEWLLSTSQDATVRVWNVTSGECISIFGGHTQSTLGAVWSPWPQHATRVLSGGGDCCLRLWDIKRHAAADYQETRHEVSAEKRSKKKQRREEGESVEVDEAVALAAVDVKKKNNKKFLLSLMYKQTHPCEITGPRRMLQKYLERSSGVVSTSSSAGEEHGIDYIKIFGNINEVNELLDAEMERHQDTGNLESWTVLCIVRGFIDAVIQWAVARDQLDPFLLSIAPSVSFKYWKDATLLYLQQIDRLVAKGEELKLCEAKAYGGAIFRKVAVQLSLHDVKGAVNTLMEARLYKEAYVLSRTRYMDSLAEQTLRVWALDCASCGQLNLAAVCYIVLGDLSQAAAVLGKSTDEESLSLAADIAKILGQTTFAGHIEEKREQIKKDREKEEDKDLKELPSRVDLVVQGVIKDQDGEKSNDDKVAVASTSSNLIGQDLTDVKEASSETSKEKDINDASSCAESKIEEKAHSTLDVDRPEQAKGNVGSDANKTEELLEQLPEKIEALMRESVDAVPNGAHKGDGDTIQNGGTDQDPKEINTKVLKNGPQIENSASVE